MISSERWRVLEPILDAALELPADEVPAYLDRVCADELAMRDEVECLLAMLREERDAVGFLDSPPNVLAAHVLSDPGVQSTLAGDLSPETEVGPYRVVRRLGHGGMGVVYLARDPRLDRMVAVKLLPPWLAVDESATRRFAEEAKASSALDHPNIGTVYDIGTSADGRQYIAMAYYEGETLEARILRGPLPVAEAVALAQQIAQGLAAAHGRGIVHRDIKPANVIVARDAVAKILDFGVAKLMGRELTEPSATPGTVSYMSPEQTRGRAIDVHTDLWSLGVVLYEMLTGKQPFRGDSHDAVIFAIRHDQPEPLVKVRPDVPAPLASVVHRCLEKDPRARYRDAASLANALRDGATLAGSTVRARARRRLTMLGAALLVTIVGGGVFLWPGRSVTTRLAVLPLVDSGADSVDRYFADGLTEELITRLSTLRELRVTALASVMAYRGTDKDVTAIGHELNAGVLVAGSVAKVGDRVRISARLIDAADKEQLWTEDYDVGIAEVPTVMSEIPREVANALDITLRARERRQLAKRGTESTDAYLEYLKGRYFVEKQDSWAARNHFDRSLDLDPTFAAAWAGLALTYIQLSIQQLLSTKDGFARGRAAAERALELDSEHAEAHAHLASALNWYDWDRKGAERHLQQAIALDPSSAWTHWHYAVLLRNLGRFEEALRAVGRARELDPLSSARAYEEEGVILYFARRHDAALARFQQLLQVDPRYPSVHFFMALVYAQTGRYEKALASLRQTDPQVNQPDVLTIRGYLHARLEQPDEARRVLARLELLSQDRTANSFGKALIHIGLGEHDRALNLLEQAAEERTWHLGMLKVEPILDPLRGEPRFQALLKKLNLAG